MTKKDMAEKILTEILTCHELVDTDDGVAYKNVRQELGTYQDGLIYALNIIRNEEYKNK